jgi:hypothetical protein
MMSLGFLGKNLYDLGGRPFSLSNFIVNFKNMSITQKGFMAFMILRLMGMSPI